MAVDKSRAAGNRTPSKGAKVKSSGSGRLVSKKATSGKARARASTGKAGTWQPQQRAKFVVDAVGGTRRAADLLDVSPSQPSRWASGESVPGPGHARMLVDLEHVLTHALLVWADVTVAQDWLSTPNAHLDGARPVDWIRMNGTAEVVDALRAEAAGAYA